VRYTNLDALPYERILFIDFEYEDGGVAGNNPRVVCLVVRDFKTGAVKRYWRDALFEMIVAPFDIGPKTLVVAYFASAEMQCFMALGWPMPENLLDPFAEFRRLTNGQYPEHGHGLVGALRYFGLDSFVPAQKDAMRQLVLSGGPWSEAQQSAILDYCQSDVDALGPLLAAMLAHEPWTFELLGQALMRGRYTAAVGVMQSNGIPIDLQIYSSLQNNWPELKSKLIARVDAAFCIYEGGSFKEALFEAYLAKHGIAWPRLATGRLKLDRDTFSSMSKRHPQIRPLHELRKTLGELRLNSLAVGDDGRNRAMLSPFSSKTGRNQPSTSKFVFGPSKWFRGLIKPTRGTALAYLDWGSQEIAIAAALSGDELLWDAYASGDPYIAFAIQAGLAPEGATKATHKAIRDRCKQVVLGTNYGMSAFGVAEAAGIHVLEAQDLLQKHRETYHKFWKWADENKNRGLLGLPLETCFGWQIQATEGVVKANTFLNWPMQAHGAEMMRIACCLAVERGIKLCAPIHDALLIEAPINLIDANVAVLKQCMADASELVLGHGRICRVDAEIIRYPDRYMDENGAAMWEQMMEILDEIEG
jgi:DNA polymerase-1